MRRLAAALCLPTLVMVIPAQQDAAATTDARDQQGFTVPLAHRGQRKWKLKLPNEQWKPVGTAFRLAKTHGHDFATKTEGTRLKVDSDGDGEFDVTLEGKTAFVILRGKSPAGKPTAYAVRLQNKSGWQYAPGGYLSGKVKDTPVKIIDQNGNGRFDDIGQDALIVGRGKVACLLSEAINVGGELYQARVSDGTELVVTPYTGPTGKLQLECGTKGKVLSAIVQSTNGRYSFDMAKATAGMKVPVGGYRLVCGELGLAESRVKMVTGKSQPLAVAKNQTKKACWGGPVKAEFDYQRQDGKVHLSPAKVWYFGAAGEQYVGWVPLGASPKFTITNSADGKEVAQAHVPGSC